MLAACFGFMFRWIFEQLLKGAESLWQVILISYSLYKHAAIKPFHSVLKTAICRAQHVHSTKVGSNTRLRQTTAGKDTQEAWISAWAARKSREERATSKTTIQKWQVQQKLWNRKHTSANFLGGKTKPNQLNKIKKLYLRTGFAAAEARDLHLCHSRQKE